MQKNRRTVIVGLIVILICLVGNGTFWAATGSEGNRNATLILAVVLGFTVGAVIVGRRRGTV